MRRGADIQRELSAKGWWFDTSTVSPEDTAQKIIAGAGERAVVAGDRLTTIAGA